MMNINEHAGTLMKIVMNISMDADEMCVHTQKNVHA